MRQLASLCAWLSHRLDILKGKALSTDWLLTFRATGSAPDHSTATQVPIFRLCGLSSASRRSSYADAHRRRTTREAAIGAGVMQRPPTCMALRRGRRRLLQPSRIPASGVMQCPPVVIKPIGTSTTPIYQRPALLKLLQCIDGTRPDSSLPRQLTFIKLKAGLIFTSAAKTFIKLKAGLIFTSAAKTFIKLKARLIFTLAANVQAQGQDSPFTIHSPSLPQRALASMNAICWRQLRLPT